MDQILKHTPMDARAELELVQASSQIEAAAAHAIAHYFELVSAIQALEAAGLCCAHPWYKDGEYLYLVYPTQQDGSRKRQYIGNKPARIADAEAAMQRYRQHSELVHTADKLRARLQAISYGLQNYLRELSQYKPQHTEN